MALIEITHSSIFLLLKAWLMVPEYVLLGIFVQTMGGHKKQKLCQERDILSTLPDCVLTHILFFLPTKDAVSTCILSSRWRDLWVGLPNIDLDDRLLYFRDMDFVHSYEYVPFMDFVDRILCRHGLSNMTRFRLSCVVCFCPSRISTWISFAIRQNLQELDLHLDLEIPFVLPQCVFSCTSLSVLKIDMECALVVPQMVSLPNLKTLYLVLVEFSDEDSANKLFGSCPILEELYLLDCEWRVETVTISTPKLRRLRIDDHYCCGLLHESSDCIIEVQAPNLISFKYSGNLSNEIFLKKSPLLATASIVVYIEPAERIFDMSPRVAELINGLQNVEILMMSNDAIQVCNFASFIRS